MGNAHKGMNSELGFGLSVKVNTSDEKGVEKALGKLRRAMQNDRWVRDVRAHDFFVGKGEKRRKAVAEARRRQLKVLREEDEDLTHDAIHHASALKRGKNRKARRAFDKKVQMRNDAEQRGDAQPRNETPFYGDYRAFTEF